MVYRVFQDSQGYIQILSQHKNQEPQEPVDLSWGEASSHPPEPHLLVAVRTQAGGLIVLGAVNVRAVVEGAIPPSERSAPTLI